MNEREEKGVRKEKSDTYNARKCRCFYFILECLACNGHFLLCHSAGAAAMRVRKTTPK
jgi:hypothetical protein